MSFCFTLTHLFSWWGKTLSPQESQSPPFFFAFRVSDFLHSPLPWLPKKN